MPSPEAVAAAQERRTAAQAEEQRVRQWYLSLDRTEKVRQKQTYDAQIAAAVRDTTLAERAVSEAQTQSNRNNPAPRPAPAPRQPAPLRPPTPPTPAQAATQRGTVEQEGEKDRNAADPTSGMRETNVQRKAREDREANTVEGRRERATRIAQQQANRDQDRGDRLAARNEPKPARTDSPVQIATVNNTAARDAENARKNQAKEQLDTVDGQVDAMYKAGVLTQQRRESISKDAKERYDAEMEGIQTTVKAAETVYRTQVQQRQQDMMTANARLAFTKQITGQVITRASMMMASLPKGSMVAADWARGMMMLANSAAKEWGGLKEIAHVPIPQNLLKVAGYQLPDQLPTMPTSAEVDWRLAVSMAATGTPLPGWQGPIGIEALRLSREPERAKAMAGAPNRITTSTPIGPKPATAAPEKIQAAINTPEGQAILADETRRTAGVTDPAQLAEASQRLTSRVTALANGDKAGAQTPAGPARASVADAPRDALVDIAVNGKDEEKLRLFSAVTTAQAKVKAGEALTPQEKSVMDNIDPGQRALINEAFTGNRTDIIKRGMSGQGVTDEEKNSIKEGLAFFKERFKPPVKPVPVSQASATTTAAPGAPATAAPATGTPTPAAATASTDAGTSSDSRASGGGPRAPAASSATPGRIPATTAPAATPTDGSPPTPVAASYPARPANVGENWVYNGDNPENAYWYDPEHPATQNERGASGVPPERQQAAPAVDPANMPDFSYVDDGKLIRRQVGAGANGEDVFTEQDAAGKNFQGVRSGTVVDPNDTRYNQEVRDAERAVIRQQVTQSRPGLGPLMDRADRGETLTAQEQAAVDEGRKAIDRTYFQRDAGVPVEAGTFADQYRSASAPGSTTTASTTTESTSASPTAPASATTSAGATETAPAPATMPDFTYVDNGRLIRREVGAAENGADRFTDVSKVGENQHRNFQGVASGTVAATDDERYAQTVRTSQERFLRDQLTRADPALKALMDRSQRGETLTAQEQAAVANANQHIQRAYLQRDKGVPMEADQNLWTDPNVRTVTGREGVDAAIAEQNAPTAAEQARINLDVGGTETRVEKRADGRNIRMVKSPETNNQWIEVDTDDPRVKDGEIAIRKEDGSIASQRQLEMPRDMLNEIMRMTQADPNAPIQMVPDAGRGSGTSVQAQPNGPGIVPTDVNLSYGNTPEDEAARLAAENARLEGEKAAQDARDAQAAREAEQTAREAQRANLLQQSEDRWRENFGNMSGDTSYYKTIQPRRTYDGGSDDVNFSSMESGDTRSSGMDFSGMDFSGMDINAFRDVGTDYTDPSAYDIPDLGFTPDPYTPPAEDYYTPPVEDYYIPEPEPKREPEEDRWWS